MLAGWHGCWRPYARDVMMKTTALWRAGARGERGGHTSADLRRRMIWPTSDAEGLNRRHKNTRKRIAPLAGTVSAYDVMHHIHIDSDVVGGIRGD